MNAPWKPGGALRDPFHAFVCDDHSFDVLRAVAAGIPASRIVFSGVGKTQFVFGDSVSPAAMFAAAQHAGAAPTPRPPSPCSTDAAVSASTPSNSSNSPPSREC